MQLKDVIYAAARAAHINTRPGAVLNTSGLADGLILVNQIVDQWSARKPFAYSDTFTLFTLTPAHNPYLIGPGLTAPDFAAANRPVALDDNGAALVLTTSTPNVDQPLHVRDGDWWNNERVKTLTTNVPTDVYYSPDWPNGSLYFWPIPNFAYSVRLRLRTVLAQFAMVTTTFSAPPAYLKALTLTLAEEMCDWWGVAVPEGLPMRAARARVVAQINNIASPRIASADYGTRGRSRGGFNYYSGGPA